MTILGVRPVAPAARSTPVAPVPVGRRVFGVLEVLLVLVVASLVVIGFVLVWSASRGDAPPGEDASALARRHLLNAVIGAGLAAVVVLADWRVVRAAAPLAYGASVLALVAVLSPLGTSVNGAQSWIFLPAGFSLQPSELAKVSLVLLLALVLGARGDQPSPPGRRVWLALVLAAVPTGLVLLQPDVGTVLVLVVTAGAVLLVSGVRIRWLLALAALGVGVVVAAVRLGLLRDYQLARFAVFVDPELDPLGVGYNTAQARLAIMNGGLTGTGVFEGPRTGAGLVPEQQTDFVFTVAGEELGFIGSAAIIVLIGVLLWLVVRIGARSTDLTGRLVAVGVAAWFGFQAFQNIGMTLAIMPVTGLPLPFVSYGGSSMFAAMLGVGLVLRVATRPDRTFA